MNSNRRPTSTSRDLSHTGPSHKVLRRRLGRFDWLIPEPFQRVTWLDDLEDPHRLLEPPAEPLKRVMAPGREVVRVRRDDATASDLVVKHFIPRGLVEAVKWSWRASPAYRAFEMARHLQALGLRTAAPVAAGEHRSWGWLRESFLLTNHIPDATPLYAINAGCADRRRRVRIVRSLARIYAALHDAGFHHGDPSLTNFLALPQPRGDEALVLIDLDGIRRRRRIDIAGAANDLRRLLLRCRVPRRERAWFIAVYARSRNTPTDVRQLVTRIGLLPAQVSFPRCALTEEGLPETASTTPDAGPGQPSASAAAMSLPPARVPARTCTEASSRMETRRSGGLRWQVRPSLLTSQVETILRAPDRFLEQARVLKPSRSSAVGTAGGVVLKRYNYRKWGSRFKDIFRALRGTRCFRKAWLLEIAGVPTARPIAAADRRRWFLPVRSYFLMEEIKGAVPMRSWTGDKRAVCIRVAKLLGRMHREGFTHRDLKDGNIVFDQQGQPHLIDLDGLHYVRRVSDERAVADLARLARDATVRGWRLSRSQRARFLVAYCRARKLPDWRWWWREIEGRRQ